MDHFIDINQLSEFLNVKPATIYSWIHEERIPYYKINRLVRFNLKEIVEWLEKKKYRGNAKLVPLKRRNI